MANTTSLQIASCVLLLLLILHQQDLHVQGRHLRSRLPKECSKTHENLRNVAGDHGSSATDPHDMHKERKRRVEFEVADFRPTSPGHSPGVGHSIHN